MTQIGKLETVVQLAEYLQRADSGTLGRCLEVWRAKQPSDFDLGNLVVLSASLTDADEETFIDAVSQVLVTSSSIKVRLPDYSQVVADMRLLVGRYNPLIRVPLVRDLIRCANFAAFGGLAIERQTDGTMAAVNQYFEHVLARPRFEDLAVIASSPVASPKVLHELTEAVVQRIPSGGLESESTPDTDSINRLTDLVNAMLFGRYLPDEAEAHLRQVAGITSYVGTRVDSYDQRVNQAFVEADIRELRQSMDLLTMSDTERADLIRELKHRPVKDMLHTFAQLADLGELDESSWRLATDPSSLATRIGRQLPVASAHRLAQQWAVRFATHPKAPDLPLLAHPTGAITAQSRAMARLVRSQPDVPATWLDLPGPADRLFATEHVALPKQLRASGFDFEILRTPRAVQALEAKLAIDLVFRVPEDGYHDWSELESSFPKVLLQASSNERHYFVALGRYAVDDDDSTSRAERWYVEAVAGSSLEADASVALEQAAQMICDQWNRALDRSPPQNGGLTPLF